MILDEVLAWLAEISQLAEQLLESGYGALSYEYIRELQSIYRIAHENMPELSKDLAVLLINRTPHEAVRMMSTEWRCPLICIIGYSRFMEQGLDGTLTPEQLISVQKIRALGEKIQNWNRIGFSEDLAFTDDSPDDENLP